jgi:hypothetical protein
MRCQRRRTFHARGRHHRCRCRRCSIDSSTKRFLALCLPIGDGKSSRSARVEEGPDHADHSEPTKESPTRRPTSVFASVEETAKTEPASSSGRTMSFAGSTTSFAGGTTSFAGGTTSFAGRTTSFAGRTTSFAGGTTSFAGGTTSFAGGTTSSAFRTKTTRGRASIRRDRTTT